MINGKTGTPWMPILLRATCPSPADCEDGPGCAPSGSRAASRLPGRLGFATVWVGVATATICVAASFAHAHGFGVHTAGGVGDSTHRQVGLTWDTVVAKDQRFHYRLSVARERFQLHRDGWDELMSGVLVENMVGVQLSATPHARTWLGAQMVGSAYDGAVGIGGGLAGGINWHLAAPASLGFAAGARRMHYSGLLGGAEGETVGYLRVDLLRRTAGDRPPEPPRSEHRHPGSSRPPDAQEK